MNKLINIILSGLLWRQYKFFIASLILLIVTIVVVGKIHGDYIAYAQTSVNAEPVGWSFVAKWLSWLGAIGLFFVSNYIVNARKEKLKAAKPSRSLKSILSFDKFVSSKTAGQTKASFDKGTVKSSKEEDVSAQNGVDPFAHLREKDKLRSFADLLIEKNKHK